MSTSLVVNGVSYLYPDTGDQSWGTVASAWAAAVTSGTLQKSGGTFTLTADVNFGATYGLLSKYFTSVTANPASTGQVRLASTDSVSWRNNANGADLALAKDTSDRLTWGGNPIISSTALTASRALVSDASGVVSVATTTSAEIGYVNGVTSAIQTQMNLKAPLASPTFTGTITTPLTASRVVVSNGSSQLAVSTTTSTEIDFVHGVTSAIQAQIDGKISNSLLTTTGDMAYASSANTPARLAIGTANQILKSVGGIPAWAAVPSGGVNYLSSNPDAETNTTGWTTFAGAAQALPDGTFAGSPSSTWTRTTSTPLRGTGSFLWTKSANNRQGEGVFFPFTLDNADLAKPICVSFDYTVGSGTYADGDLTVYAFDGTNVIQLAPYTILSVTAGIPQKWISYFQTSAAATSYRFFIYTASTSALAYTVKFDNFNVGPTYQSYGAVQTDWVSWTPTASWNSGIGTITGKKRQNGQFGEYEVNIPATGAVTSATLTINMPGGEVIDTAAYPVAPVASYTILDSTGTAIDSGAASYNVVAVYSSTTAILVSKYTDSGTSGILDVVTQAVPFTFGNADSVTVRWRVPLVGKSSNAQVSSDADTRVVAFRAVNTAGSTLTKSSNNAVPFATVDYDTHGAWATDTYTVPVPGYYQVSAGITLASGATWASGDMISAYTDRSASALNRSNPVLFFGTFANQPSFVYKGTVYATAGQTIKFNVNPTKAAAGNLTLDTTNNFNWITIEKVGGPAQIAASEKVRVKYQNTAGTSITSSVTSVPFVTKIFDSHSAFNGTTFTAPRSDYYRLTARARSQSVNNSTAQVFEMEAIVTSTPESLSGGVQQLDARFGNGAAHVQNLNGGGTWWLNQGDTIAVQMANSNTVSLDTTVGYNVISIESQGGI